MPRSNAGRIVPTSSDFGATKRRGHGPIRTRRPTSSWASTPRWPAIGTAWFAAGFSSSPSPGARGRSAPSAAKTSSRSPRSSTAAPTSTGSGRTRRRFSCAAIRSSPTTTADSADAPGRAAGKAKYRSISRWDHARGRLLIDTPYTQGVAGWIGGEPVSLPHLDFTTENPFAVLVATSISDEPIATSKRLLVSAIARVEPTGFRWVDSWKREVADPGRPPFLQEPVSARVVWRHKGRVRAFVLDNTGARTGEVKLETLPGRDAVSLSIDGKTAAFHWELIAE